MSKLIQSFGKLLQLQEESLKLVEFQSMRSKQEIIWSLSQTGDQQLHLKDLNEHKRAYIQKTYQNLSIDHQRIYKSSGTADDLLREYVSILNASRDTSSAPEHSPLEQKDKGKEKGGASQDEGEDGSIKFQDLYVAG